MATKSKGISLPVNTVIIIAVAALVLGIIAVFFTSYSSQGTAAISHAVAWSDGCSKAKLRGCLTADFGSPGLVLAGYNPDGTGGDDNLLTACQNFFGKAFADSDCREKCCGAKAPTATPVPTSTPTPTDTPVPVAP